MYCSHQYLSIGPWNVLVSSIPIDWRNVLVSSIPIDWKCIVLVNTYRLTKMYCSHQYLSIDPVLFSSIPIDWPNILVSSIPIDWSKKTFTTPTLWSRQYLSIDPKKSLPRFLINTYRLTQKKAARIKILTEMYCSHQIPIDWPKKSLPRSIPIDWSKKKFAADKKF